MAARQTDTAFTYFRSFVAIVIGIVAYNMKPAYLLCNKASALA